MGRMHNFTSRLNTVFFFGLTVCGVFGGISAITGFFGERTANVVVSNPRVNFVYHNTRMKWDEAEFTFDLNVDLSKMWDWNVKLVFMWVEVLYPEGDMVIIWDDIIWRN